MKKKATVLKSLRSERGAQEWIQLFGGRYEGKKLAVIDHTSLKSYHDVEYFDAAPMYADVAPVHVVIEEDLKEVVSVVNEGEFGELVQALFDKGFMEATEFGVCFTEKWSTTLNKFIASKFESAFKSVDGETVFYEDEIDDEAKGVLKSVTEIVQLSENTDIGYTSAPEAEISDADTEDAEQKEEDEAGQLSGPELDEMEKEGISDAEVDSATHEGDHNSGEPDAVDVTKSVEEEVVEEAEEEPSVIGTVFKSLAEAKGWNNPDKDLYYVDTLTFQEKKEKGTRYSYIVRGRPARQPRGAHGNKLV